MNLRSILNVVAILMITACIVHGFFEGTSIYHNFVIHPLVILIGLLMLAHWDGKNFSLSK